MANSYLEYTGNGSTTAFSITFDYLDASHIACTVNGVSTSFTLSNGGATATLGSAPASGAAIRFTRTTSQATRLTDYVAGSVLKEEDLDTDSKQAFFMGQEGLDTIGTKMGQSTANFQFDALNKRITNVANPTSAQDAATKHYIENTWLSATDKATLNSVNSNISNINAVNSNASNINSAVSNATNINTVATNIGSVNTVAGDITKVVAVANDLAEAVSEIETVADDLNETSSEIDVVAGAITNVNTVGADIANVNTVAGSISNVNSVAGNSTNINAVNSNSSNINTVAGNNTNINTVAGISSNVTSVAGISAAVTAVNNNSTNINAVNSNSANINTVAGNNTNINTVAGANTNIGTVATNITGVNSFADRYRIASSAPTSSNDIGDLYFDSTANELKVYKSSGWAAAGSTVNGTSARFNYTATANQTTFTGADTAGNTLAYDAGFADVYLNGVRLSGADITITSGTSVVLASGAAAGDILDVVGYGTFNVAAVNGSAINAGTINIDRLPSITNAKLAGSISNDKLAGSIANAKLANSSITINGSAVALGGSVSVGETKPTVADVSQTIAPATATTITITGTNFVSIPQVDFVNGSTGAVTRANTVSFTSATSLSVNCTVATGNYYVRIENPDGNAGRSTNNIITASVAPTFSTSAGSLGTFQGNFSGTLATIAGSSDSTIAYSETTSNLSGAGVTLNTSTGALTTTDFGGASTTPTTYNFTIRITDAENQTADRSFSLSSSFGASGGGQFN